MIYYTFLHFVTLQQGGGDIRMTYQSHLLISQPITFLSKGRNTLKNRYT
jgi:hypothetical protein